jgi:hypothetical protein
MNRIEQLLKNYKSFVSLPWKKDAAGAERVWFAVYDKTDERRLRARIGEFELATKESRHGWYQCDMTDMFAQWLAADEYKDSYFQNPDDMANISDFSKAISHRVVDIAADANENDVVALYGVASLFGFTRVSELVSTIQASVKGRLLVFFPGEYENNVYRLLDARDGWNYLATPITAHEGIYS